MLCVTVPDNWCQSCDKVAHLPIIVTKDGSLLVCVSVYICHTQAVRRDMKKYQMMFEQEDRSTRSKASKVGWLTGR